MLVLIDNYDSFTYNLVQYFGQLGVSAAVHRNDRITLDELEALRPERLVISPGPRDPDRAGISCAAIRAFAGRIPVLGVCLGHQSIGQVFGGTIIHAAQPMHGKVSPIAHDGRGVFAGLPNPFEATRYHSLVIERDTAPACLDISAWTAEGEIMGVRHRVFTVEGVQFHPESILTEDGLQLLQNFLHTRGGRW
ncbi:MAG TPA: aminodeoxychorismate/anthranilate synthase component II [Armatimonadota bacterium]|nr:aminodeoxychorismate/anthranilate synthase component II [Armatimonadota bacterium]HOS43032.1 aminodeoxychorismate/anthranilate synthase component II [Armatimonadota bacterium]